jgi:hypothetical protein
MKTVNPIKLGRLAAVLILLFFSPQMIRAQAPPGGGDTNSDIYNVPLQTWSFSDPTNWTSDSGELPISFTNLSFSHLGNGRSLVVDTNVPAWLNYRAIETDGTTNLVVNASGGSVTFWFAPGWSSADTTNGVGPQEWGRLFEVGAYTTNSDYGWFSLYTDLGGTNLYFSAQTNDYSSSFATYLTVPISWTTNYFHFIALTYSATNTALYIDGGFVTNGTPLTVYPGAEALANGFWVGGGSNGMDQAHGLFNSLATYNYPLNADTISAIYSSESWEYLLNPLNSPYMSPIHSAPSEPSYSDDTFDAIGGQGSLQLVGSASTCYDGTDSYDVWLTNVTTTVAANGTMNLTFTVEGGADGVPFDVFGNSVLNPGIPWVWLGQAYHCNTYAITNLPSGACFLILGTPYSTSGSGLTDAYEKLVLGIDPNGPQADAYGVPYAWYAMNGMSIQSATQDPDHDGLLNYQEYEFGTKPQVSEGFSIWVSTPNGTSSIP